MKTTLAVLAIGVVGAVSTNAAGQPPATIHQMTTGMAAIRTSIGDGDIAAAAKGLGGLYDNGGGGFAKNHDAVDASAASGAGYTGAYTPESGERTAVVVPPPSAAANRQDADAGAWAALATAAGGLGAFLMLARAENTTPDGTPSPPRENPSGDRDVQRGFDENQRRRREDASRENPGQASGEGQGRDEGRGRNQAPNLIIELLRNMQEET